ncbi:hypothetical protein D3C79_987980 [compost metagenome]
MPWISARCPSSAAPMPPKPNIRPKNTPAIMPTLPGTSSWAKTTMAENAEARMKPMIMLSTPVQNRST